jgi:hypothetical protein
MGFIVKAIKGIAKAVIGVVTKIVGGIFGFLVGGKKKKATSKVNNITKSLEPEAARKIVFGKIAAPLDIRFWEVYGASGQFFDEVIAHASHKITSYKELYMEDKLAIDASGVVQTAFVGILTRNVRFGTPGQTALTVGSGTLWTSTSKFTGCAYSVLTWLPDEKKLPNGIPSRYTQIIEGAPVYDPRRDSTQPGGSGTHRINDQTTWDYATLDGNGVPIGRNNALQALWYLIGWRITNPTTAEAVLVAGRGVDPTDINIASFIAGANNCEISGYYTDLALSTDDAHTANEDKITCNGLIGRLIDPGGLWSYYANVNDTASVAVTLTDDDILDQGSVSWVPKKGMNEQFNQVVGKFINPSTITLYQPFPYPMVRDATYEANLGIKKRATQDFEQVLDATLAQRLARLKLNANQYQGELSAVWGARAIKAQSYSVVRYNSARFGWNKLFRVWRHEIAEGQVTMLLKEIDASIWSAGTVSSALVPAAGAPYDPTLQITASNVTIALTPMTGANGTLADGFTISWAAPPVNVRRSEIRYRLVGTSLWLAGSPVGRDVLSITIGPLFSGAIYEAQVRHISMHEIPGPWVFSTIAPANPSGQFQLGTTGNVNYAAIAAAGGTAVWANITGTGRPEDNADVTASHYSGGVTGGGAWIFEPSNPSTELARITAAQTAATNAQNSANAAATTANSAQAFANDVADNNKFSSDEKKRYVQRVNDWVASVPALVAQGNALGLTTQANTLNSTWTTFYNYLVANHYNQVNTSDSIVRSTFLANAKAFSDALIALSNALDQKASELAQWAGVTGSGRPENNADVTSAHNAAGFAGQTEWATYVRPIVSIAGTNLNYFPWPNGVSDGRAAADIGWGNDSVYNGFTRINMGYTDWIGGGYYQQSRSSGGAACTMLPYFDYAIDGSTIGNFCGVSLFGYCGGSGGTFSPYMEFWTAGYGTIISNGDVQLNTLTNRYERVLQIPAGTAIIRIVPRGIFSASGSYQDLTWNRIKLEFNLPTANVTPYQDQPPTRQAISRLSPANGRVADPRFYNTQLLLGPNNTTNLGPTYTVGGSNVTVNLPAHSRTVTGPAGPLTLSYGSASGVVAFNAYWIAYLDDPNMTGNASPAVTFTANPNDLLYPGRYQIASGVAPASGGGGGSTGGGGGGGYGDQCVEIYSYMPTGEYAFELEEGDDIIVLEDGNYEEPTRLKVNNNFVAQAECVQITSESGISLILSKSTPCTLRDGSYVKAEEVFGYSLAVLDGDGFRWEPIVEVLDVGVKDVAHISCKNSTYAAGLEDGRYIFTHNFNPKP